MSIQKNKEAPMLDSVTNLRDLLKDPSLLAQQAYVAGEWVDAADGATFEVTNPARGDVIARVPNLTRADAARAIAAAAVAQKEWAARTGKERAAILRKWFDLMMANQDDLGIILCAEMGKPLAEAKGEVAYGASFIEWFGEEAKRVYGETIPGHQRDKRITVIKQPIGVVASITPWNFPNAMITRKCAPALVSSPVRRQKRRCRRWRWPCWRNAPGCRRASSRSSPRPAPRTSGKSSARTPSSAS
jgi:succinate-semialdehyde dehydrogenase/glutarate-semialdehyde dehydrogenase